MRCIRYILGIHFATHGNVSRDSLRLRCDIRGQLCINRLRWLGHLAQMNSSRIPHKALFSRLNGDRLEADSFPLGGNSSLTQSDSWLINTLGVAKNYSYGAAKSNL